MTIHLVNAFTESHHADCCGADLAGLPAEQISLNPDAVTCGGGLCSDCLQPLADPAHHCQDCGDHVDGLGECNSGCES